MEDIATWLGQQLDEDERFARSASGTLGTVRPWYEAQGLRKAMPGMQRADCLFIARNDPARILREIAAKRRVLARHRSTTDDDLGWWLGACHGCGRQGEFSDPRVRNVNKCPELRDMASGYADRPGYKDEWRVGP